MLSKGRGKCFTRCAEQTGMLYTAQDKESKVHHLGTAKWRSVLPMFAQQYPLGGEATCVSQTQSTVTWLTSQIPAAVGMFQIIVQLH